MNHQSIAHPAQPFVVPDEILLADHLIGSAISTAESAGVPIEQIVAAVLRSFIHLTTTTGVTAAAADALHTLAAALASSAEVHDIGN